MANSRQEGPLSGILGTAKPLLFCETVSANTESHGLREGLTAVNFSATKRPQVSRDTDSKGLQSGGGRWLLPGQLT